MAKSNNTVSTAEAVLLELADLIIKTYGNSAATPAAPSKKAKAEPEVEEEDAPEVEEVEADEADADSLEEERDELMALTIGEIRKRLVARGFDEDDVKKEKSKATLVDALIADLYSDEEDEDADDEEDEEVDEEDIDDDESEDDEDDDEGDDDEDDESAYTEEELKGYSPDELKAIAAEWELDVKKGSRSPAYIKAILAAQEEAADEAADEDEEEDDEALREELEELSLAELKKVAKNDHGLSAKELKGLDTDAIIDLILESGIEDEDDEDDEDDE